MKLMSKVAIKSFRSIREDTVTDLGDFTAFAGLNNSGKSNVLRALNAFFNIDRDYFQKFGWRQAAIWAVEERRPGIFLYRAGAGTLQQVR